MFDAPATKPQSVGDVIGRGFRIYRVNIPLFVQALMWPTIVSMLGKVVFQWGLTTIVRANFREPLLMIYSIIAILVGLVVSLVALYFLTVRQLSFVRLVDGFAESYKEAHKHVSTRGWMVVLIFIVSVILGLGLSALWMIASLVCANFMKIGSSTLTVATIAFIAATGSFFWAVFILGLITMCAMTVVACEKESLAGAILRGFGLIFHDLGRAWLFGVVLAITISAISYPLSLPIVGLTFFEFFRHGVQNSAQMADPSKIPFYVLVLSQAWESTVNMMLWPIIYLSFGLLYYDLRVRQEAVDVVQTLNLLEQKGTA